MLNFNHWGLRALLAMGLSVSSVEGEDAVKVVEKQAIEQQVLTPPEAQSPRINGPRRFGVRPGSPLLYTIPATGVRPMSYSANGLPEGVKLDESTGRLTGSISKNGEYTVKLVAKNEKGSSEKALTIVVGDTIALTPPMGWNSWNCWAGAVDQEKVLSSAKAMVDSGLINHGWTYINIDDCWQGVRGGELNALQPDAKKFPDIKKLCDDIHGMGLKAGIYSTPWVRSYGNRMGGSAENEQGADQQWPDKQPRNKHVLPFEVGKFSFATNDANQFAAWGIDYLKYDWGPVDIVEAKRMHDALNSAHRDIFFSVSNNHVGNIIKIIDDLAPTVGAWRTTTDIVDNWGRVSNDIGFNQDKWAKYLRPGQYPDPDMLVVGYVGWGPKLHPTRLTADEQYAHMSLWCLLSAPLLIGCDLAKLDAFTIGLLSNDEVLAIDQDSLVKAPRRITLENNIEVFVKDLDDGTQVVGIFNRGDQPATTTITWQQIGLSGKMNVRDLWRQQDVANDAENVQATIARHGVYLIKLSATK